MYNKSIVLFISIILLFLGCSKDENKTIPDEIKFSYIPFSADLPFFVALNNGYFKKNNLYIKPIECKNSSEALDLVLSGKTVGSMGNSFSVLFSIHAIDKNKIRLINVSSEFEEGNRFTTFILIGNGSDIKTINDLKGKVIGAGKGLSQLLWVKLFLQKHNIIPETDLTIIQESSENLLGGLKTNQFKAIFVFEPYGTIGLMNNIGKEFQPFFRKFIMNPFPAGGAVLSKDFIDKYPTAAKLVVKSLDEAIDFINKNPIEAKKSLIEYTPSDSLIAVKSNIYYWWSSVDIKDKQIQKLADIMYDNSLFDNKIYTKNLIYGKND